MKSLDAHRSQRHPREGGDPGLFHSKASNKPFWIPAFAGMTGGRSRKNLRTELANYLIEEEISLLLKTQMMPSESLRLNCLATVGTTT